MRIGDAAARLGIEPHVLRYWEEAGVLVPRRLRSGHRDYDEDSLGHARLIRYPHDSFSRASRSTTDRTVRCVAGRPERTWRDSRAHRRRMMSRCQRKIVPGVTISRISARRSVGTAPQAAPATPGPATSNANEREAARAQPQQADGAA